MLSLTNTVINDSTVPVTNIVLTDIIDLNTLFINGTVTVNDVFPFANPNTGILLGDFQPSDAAIINFQVVITGGQIDNFVTNITVNGLATVNPNQPPVSSLKAIAIPLLSRLFLQMSSTTVVKTAVFNQQQ